MKTAISPDFGVKLDGSDPAVSSAADDLDINKTIEK
jgi:hypothetical protein